MSGVFYQAEDGIRDAQESRGLGDVYRDRFELSVIRTLYRFIQGQVSKHPAMDINELMKLLTCLLYTSHAADELLCVELGGRRVIKKKNNQSTTDKRGHGEGKR